MRLYELVGMPKKLHAWTRFREHHYTPDVFNEAARCFVAVKEIDGRDVLVGFAAALRMPSGTVSNAWCSHKIVALPPKHQTGVFGSTESVTTPDWSPVELWREVADTLAQFFLDVGFRYFCNASDAPPELVAYRNDSASGWIPTSKNGKPPRDKGHGAKYGYKPRSTNANGVVVSHEFVGVRPFCR